MFVAGFIFSRVNQVHLFGGFIKLPLLGESTWNQTIHMYGHFERSAHNNVFFGLVSYNHGCFVVSATPIPLFSSTAATADDDAWHMAEKMRCVCVCALLPAVSIWI